MKGEIMWKEDAVDLNMTRFFELSARALLSLLIVAILAAILAGVIYTFYDMRLVVEMAFLGAFRTILVDILTVLALIEVLRTALAYFSEGRVKVTYIIDTVIVTILTEVMGFWYKEVEWQKVVMAVALVLSLACVRIIAVRFSPRRLREEL
jgi:uncharacterized membrane protein (DUF373 family)